FGAPGSGFHAMILDAGGTNIFDDASGGDAQEELTVDPSEVVLRDAQFVFHEFEPAAEPVDRFGTLREDLAARPGWAGMTALAEGNVAIANGWATSALGSPSVRSTSPPGCTRRRWPTSIRISTSPAGSPSSRTPRSPTPPTSCR